jgi:hypothetical protein
MIHGDILLCVVRYGTARRESDTRGEEISNGQEMNEQEKGRLRRVGELDDHYLVEL